VGKLIGSKIAALEPQYFWAEILSEDNRSLKVGILRDDNKLVEFGVFPDFKIGSVHQPFRM
jgi:hypothetical protein